MRYQPTLLIFWRGIRSDAFAFTLPLGIGLYTTFFTLLPGNGVYTSFFTLPPGGSRGTSGEGNQAIDGAVPAPLGTTPPRPLPRPTLPEGG